MARQTPDEINKPFEQPRKIERRCDHQGCLEEGTYRAPLSPERLTEYRWFCLDHVREYNRAWNFFSDMDEDEIEAQRRFDTVWNRPSWKVGGGPRVGPNGFENIRDDFGFFAEEEGEAAPPRRPQTEEEKALAKLELEPPVTFEAIKARYIELVKRLHPDANGGDAEFEERLKEINQAYAVLRSSYS